MRDPIEVKKELPAKPIFQRVEVHVEARRCVHGDPRTRTYEDVLAAHGLDQDGKLAPCPGGLKDPSADRVAVMRLAAPWWRRLFAFFFEVPLTWVVALFAISWTAAGPHDLMHLGPLMIGATLLVNTARAIVTNRLRGSGTEPLYLGWGTGAQTTTLATDTTLGPTTVERDVDLATATGTRTTGTSSQQTVSTTNDTWQNIATRTATGAGTVTCIGLFDNATIASGNLFLKADFVGVALAIGDSLQITARAQYA